LPALLVALVATMLAAAPATAGARFYVEQLFVAVDLNTSPWAVGNDVLALDCKGLGRSRRDGALQRTYASFRCAVIQNSDGRDRGAVLVVPTGPESVRVARALSGDPPPDRPIGPVPHGAARIRSADVPPLLQRSRWARGHRFVAARCYGVGPFVEAVGIGTAGAYFGAFVCKTTVPGERGEVVLVATTGTRSVRVARKLA
jgi:hypothetical protein